MTAWKHLNRIEELTFPIDGAASVVKLVAEQVQDNEQSGALWLASDVMNQQAEAISEQVGLCMQELRALITKIESLERALAKAKKAKK